MVPIELADRFVAAIEQGDEATLLALLAPECTVNPNFLDTENDRDTTLRVLRWLHRNVTDFRYEIVRRSATDDGYVQQHVLHGVAPDGSPIKAPACLVVTVVDGRIVHIDEYLDSAHVRALVP
jgi:ketosteroid isomerase-like protein